MHRTFTARLNDGTTHRVSGPAIRVRIEGRYRYFVVHPPIDIPDIEFLCVISEVTTGLRLGQTHRMTTCERTARRWARQRIAALLKQGLGPRIHQQIETRQPEKEQDMIARPLHDTSPL